MMFANCSLIAPQRGESFLLALVTEEARRSANLEVVRRFAQRTDGSRMSAAELTGVLDQARAEREGRVATSGDPR
jgi:hypothetical protein